MGNGIIIQFANQRKTIKKNIEGFPGYTYENGTVYKPNGEVQKELIGGTPKNKEFYKMKDENGKWKNVSKKKILSIVGETIDIPNDAVRIDEPGEYYVDKKGTIYSFSKQNPNGIILKQTVGKDGYLRVRINGKNKNVHTIVANSFLMKDYVKKGLCCMHKDNNKLNPCLDNLCIGTYSQNNKDAYKDGLNKGNTQGINRKLCKPCSANHRSMC